MSGWILTLILMLSQATGIDRTQDPALAALAQTRSVEIVNDFGHHINHRLPDWYWGEVIGYNGGMADPVASIVDGWRNSPSHWDVLTNPGYTRIGCGITKAEGSQYAYGYRYYFVCIVGRRDEPTAPTEPPVYEIPDTAMEDTR